MDQSGRLHKNGAEGDRFIPNRSAMDFDRSHHDLLKENATNLPAIAQSPCKQTYVSANTDAGSQGAKILAYKTKAPAPKEGYQNNLRVLYAQGKAAPVGEKKPTRHFPQNAERTLDLPELLDDYYLNLLDWSSSTISLLSPDAGAHRRPISKSAGCCFGQVAVHLERFHQCDRDAHGDYC